MKGQPIFTLMSVHYTHTRNFLFSSGKTCEQNNDSKTKDHYEAPSSPHYVRQDLKRNLALSSTLFQCRLMKLLPLVMGSQVDETFVEDLMESLASNQPVLILDPDQTAFSKWIGMLPRAIGSMDATKITNQLRILIDTDNVDSIFFLAPSQAELISRVTGWQFNRIILTQNTVQISARKLNQSAIYKEGHMPELLILEMSSCFSGHFYCCISFTNSIEQKMAKKLAPKVARVY